MGKLFVNSELVESNGYEAHIGDETDARIPWKITGNKIERDGSETRALARACIPEQPDLIDSLTFEFKKRSSLDLRINKLTKLLPSLLVNTMESEPCHDFSLSLSKTHLVTLVCTLYNLYESSKEVTRPNQPSHPGVTVSCTWLGT
ncbi:hypothetical protein HZH68_002413 [Vespula germanica]|uniref:Uncharacterized protein n=2 Tax=Vespula TaxID=7451 RepID=A0A834U020_VESGE|nr:hypothetical protein HZH68_002413 [Vespula germanica]KAF7434475.1 hypothetical protein H0235_002666 [Vespula pensylvanica]